jgi:hypothetical protein
MGSIEKFVIYRWIENLVKFDTKRKRKAREGYKKLKKER